MHDHFIVGHVGRESTNGPVAEPIAAFDSPLFSAQRIAHRVCIASDVHPVTRESFCELGRGQQFVNQASVSVGARSVYK